MLRLAFIFFVGAIVAGVLGFTKIGSSAMFFSRIMIVVFLILGIGAFMVGKLKAKT